MHDLDAPRSRSDARSGVQGEVRVNSKSAQPDGSLQVELSITPAENAAKLHELVSDSQSRLYSGIVTQHRR